MHTQTSPQPSYHIPGGFEVLYQRSSSLTIYSDNEEVELEGNDGFLDNSYPGCMYGKLYKSRCLSGSLSSSQSDDSLEGRHTSLEDYHFEKALNQGVFNGVSAYNKRERKRSYRKVRKKAHSESSCDSFDSSNNTMNPSSRNDFLYYSKQFSSSNFDLHDRDNSNSSSSTRRKESLPKRGERFRKELSSCGIDLHDANDKMNIEEIYELQQRFFTGLKIGADSNEFVADIPDNTQIHKQQKWKKKRCVSSIN